MFLRHIARNAVPHYLRLIPVLLAAAGVLFATGVIFAQTETPTDNSSPTAPTPKPQVLRTTITVEESYLDPAIDRPDAEVFRKSLFSRDDQIFHLLDGGINAGQHEGGGKSIEIRRFGFNLDHGGVGGGMRIVVDGVPQNQTTQGHGQGYLGSLKSLSPELVEEVSLVNGPFRAEYGDFSGLGVVEIRTREALSDALTLRLQGGSFNTWRGFVALSPELHNAEMLVAYDGSSTEGPFLKPLDYRRDNLTGAYVWRLNPERRLGVRVNGGSNDFTSSGQIPLREVVAGRLDRFGSLDPGEGGRIRSGTAAVYLQQERGDGSNLRFDVFAGRSLFDLYSNFTFFLNDPVNGDGIQQHDSRLQEGASTRYAKPHNVAGAPGVFKAGVEHYDSQINVGLYNRVGREPTAVVTSANARVANSAGYLEETTSFWRGKLLASAGLRYDNFYFDVDDRVDPLRGGAGREGSIQPKAGLAITPTLRLPLSFHVNYGRGVSSLDARGMVRADPGQRLSDTDFFQAGATLRLGRLSVLADTFHIHRSNELVYIADDGSLEFQGPSRSQGFEVKTAVELTRSLSFHGGVTQVLDASFDGAGPRVPVVRAPHFVANASLTLAAWHGWSGSLRMRAINRYRLDPDDPAVRATGHTVFDFNILRSLRRNVDLQLAVDNLTDRVYYETQNYVESRVAGRPAMYGINATPGFPLTVTAGITVRFGGK